METTLKDSDVFCKIPNGKNTKLIIKCRKGLVELTYFEMDEMFTHINVDNIQSFCEFKTLYNILLDYDGVMRKYKVICDYGISLLLVNEYNKCRLIDKKYNYCEIIYEDNNLDFIKTL